MEMNQTSSNREELKEGEIKLQKQANKSKNELAGDCQKNLGDDGSS